MYFINITFKMVWAWSPCFTFCMWQGCTATIPGVSGSEHSCSGALGLTFSRGPSGGASSPRFPSGNRSGGREDLPQCGLRSGCWARSLDLTSSCGGVLSPVDVSDVVGQSPESAAWDLNVEVSGSPSTSHFWACCLSCETRAAASL